jgi:3-oxoacyl-[acyl-carrier protein] reductase
MKRALVTGGDGGIGQEIVTGLVAAGYQVTVADQNSRALDRVASGAPSAYMACVDLTTEDGVRSALEAAAPSEDPLHVLVNCMGISPKQDGLKRDFDQISLDEWDRVMAVNVAAPFLSMREASQKLADHAGASVVNILSVMAKLGAAGPAGHPSGPITPSGAHYAASKAALKNLTVSFAREVAPRGIRCNGVSPGQVGRGMAGSIPADYVRAMVDQIPLGRAGTANDIASATLFLTSPEASYITGETLDVDGGWVPD